MGCQKEHLTKPNNYYDNMQKSDTTSQTVYIHNGETISEDEINWENDSLHIVYGFGSTLNEVLIFYGDNELLDWADTITNGYFFINILDSIDVALQIADERNEYDTLDLTGDVSDEYNNILKEMVHSEGKGATKLFEHINYQGDSKMIWYPTPYVGRSWNNKASSLQYALFGGVLCDYKWWGGRKVWYYTAFYGYIEDLRVFNFNDKTTSVWIY